jgi:hypothetical protein
MDPVMKKEIMLNYTAQLKEVRDIVPTADE